MSNRNRARWIVSSAAMIAVSGLLAGLAVAAENSRSAGRMDAFSAPDGTHYFAISLKPEATAPAAAPRDIVVLFNTSASQTGDYRAKALDALKSFLASLPQGDRVRLMAVDLNAVPLTNSFVAPNSRELADAMTALNLRTPLGATDMAKAVGGVLDSFAGDAKRAKAAVYFGDGRSRANLLATDDFRKMTAQLVNARIPFSSYGVGLNIDVQVLGSLAVQSGGTVISDTEHLTAENAGRQLTAAVNAAILWPSSTTWPAQVTEVFPKRLPPLRGDRETVVVGTCKTLGPVNVQVVADSAAGQQKLAFDVPAAASLDDNTYLLSLVERARTDDALTLPLVGTASLAEARQAFTADLRGLNRLAREALIAGNLASAKQLVSEALRRDPNDSDALALQNAVAKKSQPADGKAAARPGAAASEVIPPPMAPKAPANAAEAANGDLNLVGTPNEPPPGALVEEFGHARQAIRQQTQIDVQNVLNKARSEMGVDPDSASQRLRLELEKVRQTPELDPDARDQYVDLLQSALMEASRRRVEVEQARQQRMENAAAARERLMATDALLHNQDKAKQLLERYNALLSDAKYHTAEEVAAEAQKVASNSPTPIQATLFARTIGYYRDIMALREVRQKGVVDTLYQVEASHIPFPDNPPIVYPDAEWWQRMTMSRKGKWGAVDLAKEGNAEKRIREALNSPTKLDFSEQPLSDVIDFLKDYHKIPIEIDAKALEEKGVGTDSPVTRNLQGVSLRSALRLILKQLELTYLIKDEVLLITTPEKADEDLITKVYPVADLVIPIPPPGSMSGGMAGGMGAMGGSSGMGGMGGSSGMGGMGGGGGMWNVKDDVVANNAPVKAAETSTAHTPANAPKQPAMDQRPAKIDVTIKDGVNPDTVWEQYFAKHEPQPQAVRATVRQLVSQKKYDHVIGLIGAALRHRQGQAWMYEALALALDAAGRPKAEIERAVMSAVDFAQSAPDLMYIGTYLSRLGLNARAIEVYRLAANVDPVRPEPYMLALKAARAANDQEGLKWASLGIVGQAWPKQHADVWEAGLGVTREILDKLRAENKTKEAEAFQAAVNEAMRRDCVVLVDYTGEGEIDIAVEEPTGTVCSLRSPRTTGGGILIGDDIRQTGHDNFGGHSQAYVCPKGFNGKYRMLVRRVWGNVTASKVNVQVVSNFGTNNTLDVRKRIGLDKDQAVIEFVMTTGRRTESLSQQQVANAVDGLLTMNRQLLAQQLASAIDPQAMASMAVSRGGALSESGSTESGNGGGNVNPVFPLLRGGAVGYQPEITWLPEGASMTALAVISADRRYVRFTSSPLFSGVSEVNTFNMANGSSSSGSGGTGGQGYGGTF
ncbi:MAG: hypothetical protein ABFC63_08050 [Thermoguttaceae bacterium]